MKPYRTLAAMAAVATVAGTGQTPVQRLLSAASPRTVLYASVGAELTQYDVDVEHATLTRRATTTLPANVQEAVTDPSRRDLYVAWSNAGASYGSAATGALTPDGPPSPLRARPIYLTATRDGSHLIVAYNDPSGVTVHRVQANGQ